MKKIRIDDLLVKKGLVSDKKQAFSRILAGDVKVFGETVKDVTRRFNEDVEIEIFEKKYVSRGGFKLEGALLKFGINVRGKVCLDAGASTGGFTDCLLKHGARFVYAVDVARGIIDYSLRRDSRVKVIENQNIRHLSFEVVPEKVDVITADLSFISLKLVMSKFFEFLKPGGILLTLVKPQFEAKREEVSEGRGIISDESVRKRVIFEIKEAGISNGFEFVDLCDSPIPGAKGNREYFILFRKGEFG